MNFTVATYANKFYLENRTNVTAINKQWDR